MAQEAMAKLKGAPVLVAEAETDVRDLRRELFGLVVAVTATSPLRPGGTV